MDHLLADAQNHIIELLPTADRRRLLARCEPIRLGLADVVYASGASTTHAWFPIDSFVSLIAQVDLHPGLEVGMVGREGMLGAHLALGVARAPLRALVQGPGTAWRITTGNFREELARSAALRGVMARYTHVLMAQLATSAACLRFHLIGPRLARWLLMSQDRAHANHFCMTQEFLAYMLGVRRVGITAAASALQRRGLISYRRGELTVLDRGGLETMACACYAADCKTYGQLLLTPAAA